MSERKMSKERIEEALAVEILTRLDGGEAELQASAILAGFPIKSFGNRHKFVQGALRARTDLPDTLHDLRLADAENEKLLSLLSDAMSDQIVVLEAAGDCSCDPLVDDKNDPCVRCRAIPLLKRRSIEAQAALEESS